MLLPVFFVAHTYIQYREMLNTGAALQVLARLLAGAIVLFLLALLFTRKAVKASLIATLLLSVYLFYGDVKNLLINSMHLPFLAKYLVLLPLTGIAVVAGIVFIVRKSHLSKINFYLNTLLIILVLVDAGRFGWIQARAGAGKISLFERQQTLISNGASLPGRKPDIYYLLFDMYPNCELLKSWQTGPAFSLDTFLTARNFYVVPHSISNYNNTAFSMNATLNMQYLQKLSNPVATSPPAYDLTAIDYNITLLDINRAPIFPYLSTCGYSLYNLSIFRFDNIPPSLKEDFLTASPEKVFLFNTLWSCARRDIGWHFPGYLPGRRGKEEANDIDFNTEKSANESKLPFNERILDSLAVIPRDGNPHPRFVYAHLYMPHYPFFYDENGHRLNDSAVYHHQYLYDPAKFVRYVNYTNTRIKALTDSLLNATGGKAVIIIESDHGYPGFALKNFPDYFKNLEAMYFPDRNYALLHDSLSNVNTFRILLNKYFNQQLTLLPDSSIRLRN